MPIESLVVNLIVILGTGFAAGLVCKRLGVSLLIGYLLAGAIIGPNALGFVSQSSHELEQLAEAGALLLLFAVGLEFSLPELVRQRHHFFLGGALQMLAVALPLMLVCWLMGLSWNAAILAASAAALSSTVLVFKALSEWGETSTPHGRRAIAILLFQDIALVPLMMLVPMLTGGDNQPTVADFAWLAAKSLLFVTGILAVRLLVSWILVPILAGMRSVELVVLFTLAILAGACLISDRLGMPAAVGALAAGLMLGGNRLSRQIDAIVLPFRESFAAVFFVTLGTLINLSTFVRDPILLLAGLAGILLLKTAAATIALKVTGLSWRGALGMGLGLAQLGEFSFLVIAEGYSVGLFEKETYQHMLFIALGTLLLTPQLLKFGLRWTDEPVEGLSDHDPTLQFPQPVQKAVVVGIGLIGRQVASQLEMTGLDVTLLDASPINLNPFAQQGFHTVAGDARDKDVLRRAAVPACRMAVICVPVDEVARDIVRAVRELNARASVLVRCRFQSNAVKLKRAGADAVISEESEAANSIIQLCMNLAAKR